MPLPAYAAYGLISGAVSGLAGFLGAESERKRGESDRAYQERIAKEEREYTERITKEKRERAKGILDEGYAYTPYGETYAPYVSPFAEQTQATLAQYLKGELTPAQQAVLEQQRRLGEERIGVTAAGMGMPGGARAGLGVQLSRDIALGATGLVGEQQRFGMQAVLPFEAAGREEARYGYETGLAAYLRGEKAKARRQDLMLQYLT